MIRAVIGVMWAGVVYGVLVFFRGEEILNDQWDKESEKLMTERKVCDERGKDDKMYEVL